MGKAIILDTRFDSAIGTIKPIKKIGLISFSIEGPINVENRTASYSILYNPENTTEKGVIWSINSGSEYAHIDANSGILSVYNNVEGYVTIKAVSINNPSVFSTLDVHVKTKDDSFDYFNDLENATYEQIAEYDLSGITHNKMLGSNPFSESENLRVTIKGAKEHFYLFNYKYESGGEDNKYFADNFVSNANECIIYVNGTYDANYPYFGIWNDGEGDLSNVKIIIEKITGATVDKNIKFIDLKFTDQQYMQRHRITTSATNKIEVEINPETPMDEDGRSFVYSYADKNGSNAVQCFEVTSSEKAKGNIVFDDNKHFGLYYTKNNSAVGKIKYNARLFLENLANA